VFEKAAVLTSREVRSWIKSPFLSISFVIRPVLWVVVFGGALSAFIGSSAQASLGGASNYFGFLTVGMLSAMPMLLATRAGSSLFADRASGYLNRLLVAPVSRSTIAFTKVLGTILFGVTQSIVLLFLAIPFGLTVSNFSLVAVLASLAGVALLAWGYTNVFMLLSFRVKRWADQQLISSLNFPVMLFSTVFYSSGRLPKWMSGLTAYNPVSYSAEISRTLMFGSNSELTSPDVIVAFVVLVAFALVSSALVMIFAKEWL
jgi:ABC-2 type transport system permease protein